jgi:hypothetical protein
VFLSHFIEICFFNWQQIKETSELFAKGNNLVCEDSKKPQNRKYNRYRDVNPYDSTRIVLKRPIETDYINANLVKVIFDPLTSSNMQKTLNSWLGNLLTCLLFLFFLFDSKKIPIKKMERAKRQYILCQGKFLLHTVTSKKHFR